MSKFAKDIKINDIIWTISEGPKPQLVPLIVTNIDIKKNLWTGHYNLTLKFPDGSDKFMSLFDTGERRDYNVPLLSDLLPTLKYDFYDEISKDIINIMWSFDKDALWNKYIEGLEQNIKTVENIIEKGKKNLIDLNEKLNYIKKQYDNIQEG